MVVAIYDLLFLVLLACGIEGIEIIAEADSD